MNIYQNALEELVRGIVKIIGSQAVRIVLYGSVAKGINDAESDVDIAVLLRGTLNPETDDRLSEFIMDMNLKYDAVFSVIDIDMFNRWENAIPFYKNVNDEGIVLWKAA